MRTTTSLCFTSDGLNNEQALSYITRTDVEGVVFFTDGTRQAYEHLATFDINQLGANRGRVAIGRLPMYELRVPGADGKMSLPNYVYSTDDKIKWICTKVCAPYIKVSISDITHQSGTQCELELSQIEAICYHSYLFWLHLNTAEETLCFPAAILDHLTKYTYSLTAETIDVGILKQELGVHSLDYNHLTDLLSVTVGGEIFTVKLSVLNTFYGERLLPLFNMMYGRRLRISAAVVDSEGKPSDFTDMTYGELGRIVSEMGRWVQEKRIDEATPLTPDDLLLFARKCKVDDESCIWPGDQFTSFEDFIRANQESLLRDQLRDDRAVENPHPENDQQPLAA